MRAVSFNGADRIATYWKAAQLSYWIRAELGEPTKQLSAYEVRKQQAKDRVEGVKVVTLEADSQSAE